MNDTNRTVKVTITDMKIKSAPEWTLDVTVDAEVEWVKGGIGSYEFWGAQCCDNSAGWEWQSWGFDLIVAKRIDGSHILMVSQPIYSVDNARRLLEDYGIDLFSWLNELNNEANNTIEDAITNEVAKLDDNPCAMPEPLFPEED
jgi:hypothetical protein